MVTPWTPRPDSARSRARRRAARAFLRGGEIGLAAHQRPDPTPVPAHDHGTWTTARVAAANLAVLCALAAVVLVSANIADRLSRQFFFVVFILLTLFLIRRGSRLRRRGLDRLGRSVTAWAGATGALVIVSGALSLQVSDFVPELVALIAGWLIVLGVWKDLPVLVTAATVAIVPTIWGAFVWNRPLIGAVLILVAAATYARAGAVHRPLFAALVIASVVLVVAVAHQLTHPANADRLDGSDLLAATILLTAVVAAGEVESWHLDWLSYGAVARSIGAASAVALAALATRSDAVRSLGDGVPASALARIGVAGVLFMIVLWVTVANRPVRPGGMLKIGAWTAGSVLVLGALTHTLDTTTIRWIGAVALVAWGLRALRSGLRRSAWASVAGGFAVILAAVVPLAVEQHGSVALVVILLIIAAGTGGIVAAHRPQDNSLTTFSTPV